MSHLGAWLPFAFLLWTAMLRLRFDQSRLLVILSDGAEWIRSIAQWLPIETLLILGYRARGLRVSSGTVESANFHVTGARLKLQGMRWSADGAAQMAALRADLFTARGLASSAVLVVLTVLAKARTAWVNGVWERRTRQGLAA